MPIFWETLRSSFYLIIIICFLGNYFGTNYNDGTIQSEKEKTH